MGTTYKTTIISTQIDSAAIHTSIKNILYSINQEMSTYIDSSSISRFNALKSDSDLLIGDDFTYVFKKSKYFNTISSGAFDITIKPLVDLWGFGGSEAISSIPDSTDISAALNLIGLEKVAISNNQILSKTENVHIDLSAIAKGYAVDKISKFLKNNSLPNHMVEIGGEVKVSGENQDGNKWKIGIQDPNLQNSSPLTTLLLSDRGIATSGNYRNYYDLNGKRYSHIISPLTGYPIDNNILGVTVISNTCVDSDALATALMVMSLSDGIKLVEDLKNVEAFYVLDGGEYKLSSGFMNFAH